MPLRSDNATAIERRTGAATLLKLEDENIYPSHLEQEWDFYQQLPHCRIGFARPSHFFKQDRSKVMVMPLLGPSLRFLLGLCAGKFSLKTVLLVADQLLYRLQFLHTRCRIVHRDISPGNCLLGANREGNIVHLVDFGLSTSIDDTQSPGNGPVDKIQLVGTPMFASLSAYHGDGNRFCMILCQRSADAS